MRKPLLFELWSVGPEGRWKFVSKTGQSVFEANPVGRIDWGIDLADVQKFITNSLESGGIVQREYLDA